MHKVFAGRERDWLDGEGILLVQKKALNLEQIQRDLEPLLVLKEQPESLERFERLRRKCGL